MAIQGILVDVDYCTGCEACVLACQQEHGYSEKEFGIKITKLGPLHIDEANKVFQYDFIPQFTQWCDLCEERCGKGKKPTCVQHCQAQCLDWGPIEELAAKVNAGEALTWEDVSSANWSVANSSSPAGYIYPSLWLQENFDKNITDLPHAVQSDSYGSAFARLASGQVDILCTYADARRDYEDEWTTEYGMTNSIWDDTAVVGVTPAIYNDTISVSKTSPIMDDDFKQALGQAFINIGNTEEGKEVIAIYSHNGYQWAKSEDYDSERAAQEMIQSLNSAG